MLFANSETLRKLKPEKGIALPLVCGLFATKIAVLYVLALNTRFVMDEFWQFGQSKYLGNGFFETIWPAKAVGYAVFYKLSHWIGWDAVSMLLAGRLQVATLAVGTLVLVYLLGRSVGQTRLQAMIAVLILMSFSTFAERIFRLRSEPLAVFFAAAALLVVVRAREVTMRHVLLAGMLSGFAFLSTQKAVYFNVALGAALVLDGVFARRLATGILRGAVLIAGWLIPVAIYCLAFGPENPVAVAKSLILGPVEVATRGHQYYDGLRHFVVQTLGRNWILYALCLAGLLIALAGIRRADTGRRIALIFTLIIAVLVYGHNQPWPYVFIMALPFLVLWVHTPFSDLELPALARRAAVGIVGFAVIASFYRNAVYTAHDNRHQIDVIRRAEALLEPDDTYFDGVGSIPNRPEAARRWMDARRVSLTVADGADSDVYTVLSGAMPKIFVTSYRIRAIEEVLAPLITDRYVAIYPNILIAGRRIEGGSEIVFDAPYPGDYALYDRDGIATEGEALVDGVRLKTPVRLERGKVRIQVTAGSDAYLLPAGLPFRPVFSADPYTALYPHVYSW